MRKIWSRIFVLCMACMICMCGLCLAANDRNWITFFELGNNRWGINPSSIRVHEWGGRKFLEARARFELPIHIEYLMAIDIESRKSVDLESKAFSVGEDKPYMTTWQDISEIVNGQKKEYFHDTCFKWIKDYRPDLIKEIREHNKTAPSLESLRNTPPERTDAQGATHGTLSDSTPQPTPGTQAQPGGNVDVTGATGDMTPSGFSITEDGTVQFICRGYPRPNWPNKNNPPRIILATPASFKEFGSFPSYIVAVKCPEGGFFSKEVEWTDEPGTWITAIGFDYDSKNNVFTFFDRSFSYDKKYDPQYSYRIRVIDKNTVYCEELDHRSVSEGAPDIWYGGTLSYVSTPSSPYTDKNGCWWYGKFQSPNGYTSFCDREIREEVDAALAFLAAHGNVTEAPEDFLENSCWAGNLGL